MWRMSITSNGNKDWTIDEMKQVGIRELSKWKCLPGKHSLDCYMSKVKEILDVDSIACQNSKRKNFAL